MEGLINILKLKPHIKSVWFNSNKDWMFKPAPGFEMVSAEEVLKSEEQPEEPKAEELQIIEPETTEKKTKRKSKKSKK